MTSTSSGNSAVPGPGSVLTAEPVSFNQSFPAPTLARIGILGLLLLALQYRLLQPMFSSWFTDPNWSHGFIIPLFSLYLLFTRRDDLMKAKRRVCLWGLVLVLVAMVGEFIGVYGVQNFWISQLSGLMILFGLVLYLAGPDVIRITWLPILFLAFAIPIPEIVYNQVALPLQNIAARGSMMLLRGLGVDIYSDASYLHLISRTGQPQELTVAEACSGMHLLMAFLALGVAMAYLDYKPIWQRCILVAAGIPIAVFCNVLRVAITSWMYYIDKPELGQDFMHAFTGILMLIPALAMLWAMAWLLKKTLVDVEEDDDNASAPNSEAKG